MFSERKKWIVSIVMVLTARYSLRHVGWQKWVIHIWKLKAKTRTIIIFFPFVLEIIFRSFPVFMSSLWVVMSSGGTFSLALWSKNIMRKSFPHDNSWNGVKTFLFLSILTNALETFWRRMSNHQICHNARPRKSKLVDWRIEAGYWTGSFEFPITNS